VRRSRRFSPKSPTALSTVSQHIKSIVERFLSTVILCASLGNVAVSYAQAMAYTRPMQLPVIPTPTRLEPTDDAKAVYESLSIA
jgi:hypothetical protein